jgi:hypothetical protein
MVALNRYDVDAKCMNLSGSRLRFETLRFLEEEVTPAMLP